MVDTRNCQHCGLELPPDAPQGVCPYCVLKLGSATATSASPEYRTGSPLPAMEDLAALFPQLEIIGVVGRGGMGVVYKARQPSLDRVVALKILPLEVGRDPTFTERFSREARALARLSHPNIVAVFDSGQAGGLYYFIMEYVDGVNLRQAILAGQITPEKALAIVPQICEALQFAHEEGVVHRDIKPENVLLDRKGRVKVADFGLAKLLGMAAKDITLTGTSQAMGTLHYMAPEQFEKPQEVDHRADIYSLGVVFYELLTGKLPLGRFELPSERAHVDVRLDQVVLKTLEREPDRRYQYVSEVKTEVETIGRGTQQYAVNTSRRPAERIAPATPRPRAAAPGSISDRGRALIVLGVLLVAVSPLLLCFMGLAVPAFQQTGTPTWMSIGLLGLLVLGAAIGGIAMIVVGLLSRRHEPDDDPTVPPEKQASLRPEDREAVERRVRGPSLGLTLVAVLSIAIPIIFALSLGNDVFHRDAVATILVWGTAHLACAALIALGAYKLRHLSAYSLVVISAIMAMLPLHIGFVLGLPIGIWTLVVLSRSDVRRAFGVESKNGAADRTAHPAVVIACIVGACLFLPLMCGGLLLGYFGIAHTSIAPQATTTYSPHVHDPYGHAGETYGYAESVATPYMGENIVWEDGVPKLGPGITLTLGNAAVHDKINEALRKSYADYVAIEQKHTKRTINEAGHQLVTITVFSRELTRLEDEFWTAVDAEVTNDRERGMLRDMIPLRGVIFRHGSFETMIEIWKVGAWYHYFYPNSGGGQPQKGPQLPPEIRHLYQPELKAEAVNKTEAVKTVEPERTKPVETDP